MAMMRGPRVGPSARPVAIPDDVDDPTLPKASGQIELPLWIRWSGEKRSYDLSDRKDRTSVYEQVLTEGTADDVRWFIDTSELVRLWEDLVLSPHVRSAWERWLRQHGHL